MARKLNDYKHLGFQVESLMNILLITWNYPPKTGGMENMLFEVMQQLAARAAVDIVAPFAEPNESKSDAARLFRAGREGLLSFFLHAVRTGIRLNRNTNYDVIMTGSALVLPVAMILGFLFRVPVVPIVHGLDIIYPNLLYQCSMKHLLPRCQHIIANSQMTRQLVIARGGRPENTSVINPGIDVTEFDQPCDCNDIRERYGIGRRRFILSAGRLVKRKGILEFISHSLPVIVKNIPDVLLVVVGENPSQSLVHREDLMAQIRREMERLGLQNHVLLVGWAPRKDLVGFYHACDLFILPAILIPGDIEGFGIVLLEANAAEKPVVAAEIGGIPDAVKNGVSGILVEPGNWAAMTRSVLHLLRDEAYRETLGKQGRLRAESEFDWKVIGNRYRALLNLIVSG
ncbi:MAG: GDP-mannose-dependent alpha-(1-6)-phosphatidylinositol monomannoside mannosyltransferase [Syntrophus sp. PtaU1.Bin208]|nr:MAG: GDP-mannose-dependent alpha-(1-6)-phosphatidylinositol monomannoside mannosyltransferase [Syntrophus sp. PtaU1.Bin208]